MSIVVSLTNTAIFMLYLFYIAFGFKETSQWLWGFTNALEIIFCSDILLHFFTAYYELETFKLTYNLRDIAVNYLRGTFVFDFITAFPFALNYYFDKDNRDPEF